MSTLETGNDGKTFCIPPFGITNGQVYDIVARYLEAHPEQLRFYAATLVMTPLGTSFPCKNDKGPGSAYSGLIVSGTGGVHHLRRDDADNARSRATIRDAAFAKPYRDRPRWLAVAHDLEVAARGGDVAEVLIVIRVALLIEGVAGRHK